MNGAVRTRSGAFRTGFSAIGAIVLISIFTMLITCLGVVVMEFSRYSQNVKLADEALAAKSRENLKVVQVSTTRISVTNTGSVGCLVVGIFRVNPSDRNPNYVQLDPPVAVPLLASITINLPQNTPESWLVGVLTSNGNTFWESS